MKHLVLITFLMFTAHFAQAQTQNEPLYNVKSLRCTFQEGYTADWAKGDFKLQKRKFGSSVIFDSIDVKNSTARLIGNVGASDIIVFATVDGINFFEKPPLGNINVTTVYSDTLKSDFSKYIAVTSRHSKISTPFPSQYHGTCEILQ